jgi:hypothetical protein
VVALRAREVDIVDAFGNRRSAVMPTSYAFVYSVSDAGALSLNPDTGWRPEASAQSRFADQHAHDAFAEVRSFFPALSMDF